MENTERARASSSLTTYWWEWIRLGGWGKTDVLRERRSWPCFDHKFTIFQLGTSGKLVINQVRRALWSRESARNIHFSGIPSCRRLICLSGLLSKDHHQSRLIVGNPLITSGPIKHELVETVNSQSRNSKIFKINCPSFFVIASPWKQQGTTENVTTLFDSCLMFWVKEH